MIHLAAGLLILSLTLAALALIAWLVPSMPNASAVFSVGAATAVGVSGVLLWYVRQARL